MARVVDQSRGLGTPLGGSDVEAVCRLGAKLVLAEEKATGIPLPCGFWWLPAGARKDAFPPHKCKWLWERRIGFWPWQRLGGIDWDAPMLLPVPENSQVPGCRVCFSIGVIPLSKSGVGKKTSLWQSWGIHSASPTSHGNPWSILPLDTVELGICNAPEVMEPPFPRLSGQKEPSDQAAGHLHIAGHYIAPSYHSAESN